MSNPGPSITDTSNMIELNVPQSDGLQIGSSASALVGFYGATPAVQRSGAAQAAVVTTPAALTSYGYTQAQADAIVVLLNEIRATLVAAGLMKGSA
jgi:UDP-N-acetyl-D-mannosaminuronic acid transferase (WecB/TagA/CpsF family)